jgi:tetratricopeptide (TPR) repeat protein
LRARLALLNGEFELAVALTQEAEPMLARLGARNHEAECLAVRAEALACGGNAAASREALQQSLELYAAITADADVRGCRLLMADAWRQEGALERALGMVEAELPVLGEAGALDASRSALLARMAAWRVLAAAKDARAPRQLELAMAELQRRTAKIGDPSVRTRVLEGLPLHREITAAWQQRSA